MLKVCGAGGITGVSGVFGERRGGCWLWLPKASFKAAVPGMHRAPHGGAEDTSILSPLHRGSVQQGGHLSIKASPASHLHVLAVERG